MNTAATPTSARTCSANVTFSADHIEQELPFLKSYAQSLGCSPDDADDLVQTCLERAWKRREQFEPGTNLRGWLVTILRNAHIDRCRSAARRGAHVPFEDWYQETHMPPSQEKHIELKDVSKRLRTLKKADQTLIELSVMDGVKHHKIAEQLGIAVGTVKSRLSRARAALAA